MDSLSEFEAFTDGFHDTGNQVHDWVMRRARENLAAADAHKKNLSSPAEVRCYQTEVREAFHRHIGGLPQERPPLEAVETALLTREGYTVSPLVFQSLPGVYVTANLYRPTRMEGPAAGVLMHCGHSLLGKAAPAYQQVCIDLVRSGMVTLIIDPPGQGELVQCLDPVTGQPAVGVLGREHSFLQLSASILRQNVARYFVWNSVRALDLLCQLPEVDPARIGVTGNSGGGNQTRYLLLCDDRPAAAMPCCSLSSMESYLETGVRAFDGEQNIRGCLTSKLDFDDYLSAFAPRPLRLGAAEFDFFCIEGVLQTVERSQHVYDLLGAGDRFDLCLATGQPHGYTAPLREGCVNWFRQHLQAVPPDFVTGDPGVEAPEDLRATKTGQVMTEFPGARSLADLFREDWETTRRSARNHPVDREKFRRLLEVPRPTIPIRPRITRATHDAGPRSERIFFFSEPGVILTAVFYFPASEPSEATLLLLPEGTLGQEPARELIDALIQANQLVMIPDLRGMGAVKVRRRSRGLGYDFKSTEFRVANDLFLLETSQVALRTFDLLRHLEYLRQRLHPSPIARIHLAAAGGPAIYAMCAAALDDTLASCLFYSCLASWQSVFNAVPRDTDLAAEAFIAPEFGGEVDIPEILRLAGRDGKRPVGVADIRRADGRADPTVFDRMPSHHRPQVVEATPSRMVAFLANT